MRRRRLLARIIADQARHEAIREPEGLRELMPEVYEEIARMPERYRAPIVLCYLEGQSHEEAARILRCRLRTLQTRLQRGKARLRLRLVRRGLAPATGLLAAGLAEGEHSAAAAEAAVTAAKGVLPARLLESTTRASVGFAADPAAGLASSALGLAQGVLKTVFWNRLRHAAGLLAVLAMGLPLTLFGLAAAVPETAKSADTVTIRVLDDRGRPISGADVWMQVILHDNATGTLTDRPTGHGTTNGQGRYLMPVPEGWRPPPKDRRFGLLVLVWAHARGHVLATANAWKANYREAQSVDVALGPLTDTEFLVLDPDGKPVAGAIVEPREFLTAIGLTYSPASKFILPILEAVTDADGHRRYRPWSTGHSAGCELRPRVSVFSTSGSPTLPWPHGAEIHLRSAGKIFGRIVADRPEWTRGVKLSITTTSDPVDRETKGIAEVVSRGDGVFLIPAIAAGHARFQIAVDPMRPVLPPSLMSGSNPTWSRTSRFASKRTVRVRGSIRDRENGHPVARAEILIGHGAPKEGETGVSDSQGRFEINTLPGDVTLEVTSMPGSYIQFGDDPSSQRHRVPAGVESFDLPPIEVVRAVRSRDGWWMPQTSH